LERYFKFLQSAIKSLVIECLPKNRMIQKFLPKIVGQNGMMFLLIVNKTHKYKYVCLRALVKME